MPAIVVFPKILCHSTTNEINVKTHFVSPWVDIDNQLSINNSISQRYHRVVVVWKEQVRQLSISVVTVDLNCGAISFQDTLQDKIRIQDRQLEC